MRIAFFGGSFNPPHVSHVLAVSYALSVGRFDEVLVAPVFEHPFDKALAPFDHRCRMAELAVGWLPGTAISRIEQRMTPPNYTLRTLEQLLEERPDAQLQLMVGSDVLHDAHKWHAFERVRAIAPPFVLGRVGAEHPDAPLPILPELSSTRVRELLAHRSEHLAQLERVVPARVLDYIDEHGLYR